jgi:hypothetical protein
MRDLSPTRLGFVSFVFFLLGQGKEDLRLIVALGVGDGLLAVTAVR